MASLKSIELGVDGARDLALLDADDAVWLVVPLRWWDLATLIWWLFIPSDKTAKVKLTVSSGKKVRFRVVRVASRYMYVHFPER